MARIIVTTEQSERPDVPVLLEESVCSDHLSDDHAAAQLMQRLGWAVNDAERAERGHAVARRHRRPLWGAQHHASHLAARHERQRRFHLVLAACLQQLRE